MKTFLLVLIFAAILNTVNAQGLPQEASAAPPPQVEVLSQPDSPLRIVSAQTKWIRRSGIELYIVVENVSVKAVSSYATRDDGGAGPLNNCFLLTAKLPGKALRQGQSEGRSTWRHYEPSSPLRRLVDFVEFTDGTTWGADVCHSAESLASRRAGSREARRLLLEIFAVGGADAVMRTLKSELTGVEPPLNYAGNFREAFLLGFNGYLDRIRQANQEWGYTEIEHALKRPIDARAENEF